MTRWCSKNFFSFSVQSLRSHTFWPSLQTTQSSGGGLLWPRIPRWTRDYGKRNSQALQLCVASLPWSTRACWFRQTQWGPISFVASSFSYSYFTSVRPELMFNNSLIWLESHKNKIPSTSFRTTGSQQLHCCCSILALQFWSVHLMTYLYTTTTRSLWLIEEQLLLSTTMGVTKPNIVELTLFSVFSVFSTVRLLWPSKSMFP